MSTRTALVLVVAVGSLAACGGKAYSPDSAAAPCESGADCAGDLPERALPESATILELRELGEVSAAGLSSCGREYTRRVKVNLEERLLMLNWCEPGEPVTYGSNFVLTEADVAVIESAYAELQPSDANQCASGPQIVTLDVSTNTHPDPELLLADDDHSGCALPLLEQREFVVGLDELRSVLLSFGER